MKQKIKANKPVNSERAYCDKKYRYVYSDRVVMRQTEATWKETLEKRGFLYGTRI